MSEETPNPPTNFKELEQKFSDRFDQLADVVGKQVYEFVAQLPSEEQHVMFCLAPASVAAQLAKSSGVITKEQFKAAVDNIVDEVFK